MPHPSFKRRLQRSYNNGLAEGYRTGYMHGYIDGHDNNDYDDTFFNSFAPNNRKTHFNQNHQLHGTRKRPRDNHSNSDDNHSNQGEQSDKSSDSSVSSDDTSCPSVNTIPTNKRPRNSSNHVYFDNPSNEPSTVDFWEQYIRALNTLDDDAIVALEPEPRPFITINTELKNINDIIELGKTYSPNCDYNINMKVLHDLVEPLQELQNLIGMDKVKEDIVGHLIYLLQKFDEENQDMLHTVISGSPGVGKTTLGKILGKIYLKMGILKNDTFIIAKRSDLIGKYLGHTAKLTQEVIKSADGGVLFIDEAYSLGNPEGRDSFSKECIDTINQNLSENRNFLCIIAGYTEELDKCFFAYNPGLKRRFSYRYNIEPYTPEQLRQIFLMMVTKNKWEVASTDDVPISFFKKHTNDFKHYGGDMETLFLKCRIEHAKRVFCLPQEVKKKLTSIDINNGFNVFKLHRGIKENTDREELYRSIYT